jgi:dolichol-phosphate mannosyltransferase
MKTAVIVLPTYNEVGNVYKLIPQIFDAVKEKQNWHLEIVVVDSNSKDGTAGKVKELQKKYKDIHLIESGKEGLGKAYKRGFKYAIDELHAFVVFCMDADLQHEAKELPNFLSAIEKGADFVIGSRYIKGGSIPAKWGLHRKIFSKFGNYVVRLGFMKPQIHEWTSGYRAIKAWLVKDAFSHIEKYSGYVFQIALLDFAVKKNANIVEIPIHFQERTEGESKISFGSYIFNILFYILHYSSFIKFAIVGATGFIVDFGVFFIETHLFHMIAWVATIISAELAVITNFILNNFWSFKHKRVDHHPISYLKSFFKFNLVSLGNIGIQAIGIGIAEAVFGRSVIYISKVLIIVFIVIPFSYFFYNKFIWRDKK